LLDEWQWSEFQVVNVNGGIQNATLRKRPLWSAASSPATHVINKDGFVPWLADYVIEQTLETRTISQQQAASARIPIGIDYFEVMLGAIVGNGRRLIGDRIFLPFGGHPKILCGWYRHRYDRS
jgi:hypothetical protein